ELKTPIFTIQGFVETLLEGAMEDQEVNRVFLLKIHKNALHLNNLVSDLIEISKIETGELKMNFESVNLGELVEDVFDSLVDKATERGIHLETDYQTSELNIWADPVRLRQVFTNLIDNAIKYSDHGAVRIRAEKKGTNELRISVSDNGVGIPDEHVERIFERFYRIDKHRSKDMGGTGLGLAIVKHTIEAHHSVIRVESRPGEGTTFSFDLIMKPVQSPELEMDDEE
ncbi:MAG: ATP-binding protein, partial [Bacteroidetes bacterium]|nr:ATP-binding protein [Bacteroidota bacterium]